MRPTSPHTSVTAALDDRPSSLADLGLFLVLAPLVLRVTTQVTTFPYWDMDPLVTPAFMVGLGPAGSMLLDAMAMAGAGVLVWSCAGMVTRMWAVLAALALLGCVPITWHIVKDTSGVGGQARIGCAWASGMLGALALSLAARDARLRLIATAVVLPLVLMFLARGIVQVAIEHAQTVASFNADRERIFTANGWTAESSMAKGYVRRLEQNEASGWFGLANVFASFMAAGVAGFTTGALLAKGRAIRVVFGAAVALCFVGIVLADAKGGYVAAALGAALAVGVWKSQRLATGEWGAWGWPLLGPVFVAGAVAMIVVRGLIGERLSEPSILFRSFYVNAAAKIAGEHPVVGVGPDGFKDAYLLAKNPLSPEEVASPHSILFDWIACLGIGGAAWGAVLIAWLWCAGRGVSRQSSSAPAIADDERRPALYLAALVLVLPTVAAAWLDSGAASPEQAAARLAGVIASVVVAGAIVWRGAAVGRGGGGSGLMLVPAAITLAVHAQIEVTGSWVQSAGLMLAIVGLASAGGLVSKPVNGLLRRAPEVLAGVLGVAGVATTLLCAVPALRWERHLALAAAQVEPIARIRADLEETPAPHESIHERMDRRRKAIIELSRLTGSWGSAYATDLHVAMMKLESTSLPVAVEYLLTAAEVWPPGGFLARREAARLLVRAADTATFVDPASVTLLLDRAMALMSLGPSPTAAQCSWRATIAHGAWGVAKREADLREALASARRAAELDPHSLQQALVVLRLVRLIDIEAASVPAAATRVLQLDDQARLDHEVRGLSKEQRAEIEALARGTSPPTPPPPGGTP